MYKYHYDHVNQQWCIFKKVDGREEYVTAFKDLELARTYCKQMNGGTS